MYLALSTVNAQCWRKGHVEVQEKELTLQPTSCNCLISTLRQLCPEAWLLSGSRGSLGVHGRKHKKGRERRTRNWGERIRVHACPWWDLGGLCTHRHARTSLPGLSTPSGHTDGFQQLHQTRAHISRVMPLKSHELQACHCGVYKNAQGAYSQRARRGIWKVWAAGPAETGGDVIHILYKPLRAACEAHSTWFLLLDRAAGATHEPCTLAERLCSGRWCFGGSSSHRTGLEQEAAHTPVHVCSPVWKIWESSLPDLNPPKCHGSNLPKGDPL